MGDAVYSENAPGWKPKIAACVRLAAGVLTAAFACCTASAATSVFESPPPLSPAVILPPSMATGENFRVADPVLSDGLMRRYVLETPFGRFDAYGRVALAARIREVHALTEIAKTSKLQVVARGVGGGVASQVETVTGVVGHPIKTVTGIPRGIAHLFHGVTDQSKEALADVKSSTAGSAGGAHAATDVAGSSAAAANRYAKRYLGLTAAERAWYQRLGVDPYTDNSVLRDAIHRNANVEAAAGFGTRFAGLAAIPGIGTLHRAEDAIYTEDPATIRARTRKTLLAYGLDDREVDRLSNSRLLSPTRQLQLLEAAEALNAVAGRGELFRHALGLTSDAEAAVYLESVGLLVLIHHKEPLASIVPGVRLPTAQRADGALVVSGAFESVYWTADVADSERQVREALTPFGAVDHEFWIGGTASDLARRQLRELGWSLHDEADAARSAAPP
jgi:hypothetical protein